MINYMPLFLCGMITYLRSNLSVFIVQVNQRIEALHTVFVIIKSDAECLFSA